MVRKNVQTPKKDRVKGTWKKEEDRLLVSLVKENGEKNWSDIAKKVHGRIGKQCRERWNNHLRPDIKKDAWSEEEEMALVKAHSAIGNKWAEIAKRIPGRSENSIKNYWNATKRRLEKKRKSRKPRKPNSIFQEYIRSVSLVEYKADQEQISKEIYKPNAPILPAPVNMGMINGGMQINISDEQNRLMLDDVDLASIFATPPPSSYGFGAGYEDPNYPMVGFSNDLDTMKNELILRRCLRNQ